MADEISVTVAAAVAKGGASIECESRTMTVDMSGVDMASFTQNVDTTNEALAIPADIAAPCSLVIVNLDSTNYVEIFNDSGNAELHDKLLPGEFCYINRWDLKGYARANTAACQIQVWAWEA